VLVINPKIGNYSDGHLGSTKSLFNVSNVATNIGGHQDSARA